MKTAFPFNRLWTLSALTLWASLVIPATNASAQSDATEPLLPWETTVPSDDDTTSPAQPAVMPSLGQLPQAVNLGKPTAETSYSDQAPAWTGSAQVEWELTTRELDGHTTNVYIAKPKGTQPRAGIVLLHEWWGLTEPVRIEAWGWATHGYQVIAVDLYDGRTTGQSKEASEWMSQLDSQKTAKIVKAAAEELAKQGQPVFVVGYGMGATWARRLVQNFPQATGLVLYYGGVASKPSAVEGITCPVLAIYAERDGWNSPAKISRFEDNLTSQGVLLSSESFDVQAGFVLQPQDKRDEKYGEMAREQMLKFLETNTPAPKE